MGEEVDEDEDEEEEGSKVGRGNEKEGRMDERGR